MAGDFILQYWDSQAAKHGASHWASWGDHWMIELELETIGAEIREGADVLDVGCANGYGAFRQLQLRRPASIKGVDFSPKMIGAANEALAQEKSLKNISFEFGDVRKLAFADASFDMAYTTRVLINLPTWEEQRTGIDECLRVTKPGGKVVLSEAFWEPLMLLNAMRQLVRLPTLIEHDFNRYLKKSRVEEYLTSLKMPFRIVDFSSIYYLGSRLLRELVTDTTVHSGYDNPFNKIFYDIERQYSGGEFGVQQAIIIEKPSR